MNAGLSLRKARLQAGMSQAQLAQASRTSQATISAYESGRKEPTVATFSRLLAATGSRLAVEPAGSPPVQLSSADQARVSRTLIDVIALGAALPTHHDPDLRFPRLTLQ